MYKERSKRRAKVINEINALLIKALTLAKENKIVTRGRWKEDCELKHNMYDLIYQIGIDNS